MARRAGALSTSRSASTRVTCGGRGAGWNTQMSAASTRPSPITSIAASIPPSTAMLSNQARALAPSAASALGPLGDR